MSFFDDDEPTRVTSARRRPAAPRRPRAAADHAHAAPDRQTARTRQAVALGAGLLVLVLIVLGVNGCLNSRQERALKDYTRDVGAIISDSDSQVAKPFFELLSAGGTSGNDLQVQVNQIRLTAEEDAKRARELSAPDEMSAAQQNLLLVLNLRQQALTRIAERLPRAQGRGQQAEQATADIAGQMQMFLASDVVYSQRTAPLIVQALDEAGIKGQSVPSSRSLPGYAWLAPATVASAIGGAGGSSSGAGTPAPGSHGHGLVSVAIGGTTLQGEGATNKVSANPPVTVDVTFQNQGENDERGVVVSLKLTAPGQQTVTAKKTVNTTKAGEESRVAIPLTKVPSNAAATLTVTVAPVPGEQTTDNNSGEYTVFFSGQ